MAQTNLTFDIFARDRTKGTFGKLGKEAGAVTSKLKEFGKRAALAGGVAATAFGVKGVQGFLQFDDAMNRSLAIMGEVSGPMRRKMESAAREVGKTTRMSASEAAESYFFLASAGLDAEQSIGAMPQVASFAQAGMFDMATATDLATDAQSALGMASDDAQENISNLTRVTDVLVKANTLANASVEQFSQSLTQKAGAALRNVNKDIEEGVAVLGVFADQGIKGERAGTALTAVLEQMQRQAINNKEEFEELNVEIFDADGNMRNMAGIVEDLESALGGMSTEQRKAALEQLGFNRQALNGIQALMGNSDALREYEGELENAGGTAQSVADNQMESFSAKLDVLKSRAADAGLALGKSLVEGAFEAGETIQEMARIFGQLPESVRTGIQAVAGLSVAVPVVAGAASKIKGTLRGISAAYASMGTVAKGATLSLGGIGLALTAATTVLGIFATAKADAKARVEKFREAIEADSGALRENSQAAIANEIATSDLAENVQKAGLEFGTVADAIAGSDEAMQSIKEHQRDLSDELIELTSKNELLTESEAARVEELKELIGTSKRVADDTRKYRGEMSTAREEYEIGQKVLEATTEALGDNANANLSAADAQRQYESAVADATLAAVMNGETLDKSTAAGKDNRAELQNMATAALQHADATVRDAKENGNLRDVMPQVQGNMENARAEFIRTAGQMGASETQAEKLANDLGLIPGHYTADVTVNNSQAWSAIQSIKNQLNSVDGRTAQAVIRAQVTGSRITGLASGGPFSDGQTSLVGEEGPELVKFRGNGEVIPHDETKRMMEGRGGAAQPNPAAPKPAPDVHFHFPNFVGNADDLMHTLRKEIRVNGGDVQRVLGQR
ncbi:phage tail tape measure protein [Haloechinothrix sp. YIM 98757]|uniref:Phage tail tape measure protein n=1 Tax=Haloechinothrix aidingensis TaxID=2752311 RepID=A0A838AB49_9PSEU|nr:phage tail tape measure protein [Haloechinothrix aidingensis]MBA0126435.1 phage tail tape measure protein [Haloechinothrix aidingensis]